MKNDIQNLSRYIGHDVVDRNGNNVGTLECLWSDHTGQPAFLGVKTGWFMGKTHVVPAQRAEINEAARVIRSGWGRLVTSMPNLPRPVCASGLAVSPWTT